MGDGNFRPPTESTPLDRSPKNLLLVITSRPLRLYQIWCKSVHEGLLGKWVKYNEHFFNLFIYTFFHQLTYRSDPLTDFHALWLKRRGFAQGCAFRGFRWHCFPFWGWNTPKTPILGAWIDVFKPNGQNIESFMLSKLMHHFNQILHNDRDHQELVAGGPNQRPTNPRWRTAAILKKTVKSLYLCNRLTDFDKIWYSDAYWPLTVDLSLKFGIFENPKWRRQPSWKIIKIAISP